MGHASVLLLSLATSEFTFSLFFPSLDICHDSCAARSPPKIRETLSQTAPVVNLFTADKNKRHIYSTELRQTDPRVQLNTCNTDLITSKKFRKVNRLQ